MKKEDTTMQIEEIIQNEITSKNKLKGRFVKDYNLPINIFNDELFYYYRNLYDFFPNDTWVNLLVLIDSKFHGNVEEWLNYCANFRDSAINGICSTEEYSEFITQDMSKYGKPVCGERNNYTEETNGKYFVSIDMKKANFQALKYAGVIKDESYDAFVDRFGGDDYIKNSKYLRQVIFGKMNPGRTIAVEKHIMGRINEMFSQNFPISLYKYIELYSLNSDELVYSIDYHKAFLNYCMDMEKMFNLSEHERKTLEDTFLSTISADFREFQSMVSVKLGIEVRCELVKITKLPIINCNSNNVDAYERHNMITGESKLKKVSTTFYPQIYKLWKGLEIEDRDLIFYADDQLAKFMKPLKMNQTQICEIDKKIEL